MLGFNWLKKATKKKLEPTHMFLDYAPVVIGKRWFVNSHGSLFVEGTRVSEKYEYESEYFYSGYLSELNTCGE